MKAAFYFTISILAVLLACSSGVPETKSRFLSSFTVRDVVEKSLDASAQDRGIRVSGGETSSVVGKRRVYHLDDTADLRIRPGDEHSFLERIKAQIERQLEDAGCTPADAGSGESTYSIEYTDGTVHGGIEIRGTRGSDDSYKLKIAITER
jgi:hypothetical protein